MNMLSISHHLPPSRPQSPGDPSIVRINLKREELSERLKSLLNYLEDLDETEKKAILHDWRYRLTLGSSDLKAPKIRKDWFLHMLMQEHEVEGLISLFHEFNLKQLESFTGSMPEDRVDGVDLIETALTTRGLQLVIKSLAD